MIASIRSPAEGQASETTSTSTCITGFTHVLTKQIQPQVRKGQAESSAMSVIHIVLFKLKDSLTEDEKREVSFQEECST